MSINYGLDKVRFPAPVPVGAKIRLNGKVAAVACKGGPVDGLAALTDTIDRLTGAIPKKESVTT